MVIYVKEKTLYILAAFIGGFFSGSILFFLLYFESLNIVADLNSQLKICEKYFHETIVHINDKVIDFHVGIRDLRPPRKSFLRCPVNQKAVGGN
jgi:hypothetical protein